MHGPDDTSKDYPRYEGGGKQATANCACRNEPHQDGALVRLHSPIGSTLFDLTARQVKVACQFRGFANTVRSFS